MKRHDIFQWVMFVMVAIVIVAAVATLLYMPPDLNAAVNWEKACCNDPCCGDWDWCLGSGRIICCIPKD